MGSTPNQRRDREERKGQTHEYIRILPSSNGKMGTLLLVRELKAMRGLRGCGPTA
jgi:hypothetical protein